MDNEERINKLEEFYELASPVFSNGYWVSDYTMYVHPTEKVYARIEELDAALSYSVQQTKP